MPKRRRSCEASGDENYYSGGGLVKNHISDREVNNGVLKDVNMQAVYNRTMSLLFAGSKKVTNKNPSQPMEQIEDCGMEVCGDGPERKPGQLSLLNLPGFTTVSKKAGECAESHGVAVDSPCQTYSLKLQTQPTCSSCKSSHCLQQTQLNFGPAGDSQRIATKPSILAYYCYVCSGRIGNNIHCRVVCQSCGMSSCSVNCDGVRSCIRCNKRSCAPCAASGPSSHGGDVQSETQGRCCFCGYYFC